MIFYTIVSSAFAAVILVSTVLAAGDDPDKNPEGLGRCTTSDSCTNSSIKCVDGFCVDCNYEPRKCMRNVESCRMKKCARDEGCYLSEKGDYETGTVVSTLVCAKKKPCTPQSCPNNQKCFNIDNGDQVPVAQCRPTSPVNPCRLKRCSEDSRCVNRGSLNLGYAIPEGICLPYGRCSHCDDKEYCEITIRGSVIEGYCEPIWDQAII